MQGEAIEVAQEAMQKYNIEKDIAQHIKKTFDDRKGPTWHCIVGRNFGSFVTHGRQASFTEEEQQPLVLLDPQRTPNSATMRLVRFGNVRLVCDGTCESLGTAGERILGAVFFRVTANDDKQRPSTSSTSTSVTAPSCCSRPSKSNDHRLLYGV